MRDMSKFKVMVSRESDCLLKPRDLLKMFPDSKNKGRRNTAIPFRSFADQWNDQYNLMDPTITTRVFQYSNRVISDITEYNTIANIESTYLDLKADFERAREYCMHASKEFNYTNFVIAYTCYDVQEFCMDVMLDEYREWIDTIFNDKTPAQRLVKLASAKYAVEFFHTKVRPTGEYFTIYGDVYKNI